MYKILDYKGLKKNVFQFLTLQGGDERQRLVPVLNTMLKLSPEEVKQLTGVAKSKYFLFCVYLIILNGTSENTLMIKFLTFANFKHVFILKDLSPVKTMYYFRVRDLTAIPFCMPKLSENRAQSGIRIRNL